MYILITPKSQRVNGPASVFADLEHIRPLAESVSKVIFQSGETSCVKIIKPSTLFVPQENFREHLLYIYCKVIKLSTLFAPFCCKPDLITINCSLQEIHDAKLFARNVREQVARCHQYLVYFRWTPVFVIRAA